MVSARLAVSGLWVAFALAVAPACGRTPLAEGDLIGNDGGSKAMRPNRPAPVAGSSGSTGSGGSGGGTPPVAGSSGRGTPPPVGGAGSGGATGGTPAPTAGRAGGIAGTGTAGRSGGGRAGSGGRAGGTPIDPGDPLNPRRCAIDEPTVLTIDPGGQSGRVQGWLESAPHLIFDERNLPRFGVSGPARVEDLGVWWSIAVLHEEIDDGELYFYALAEDTALGIANGQTDARAIMYTGENVGPVSVGEVVVWHHLPTDRYVAVRIEALYGTEKGRADCAALDAAWIFAEPGTSKFPRLP